MPESRNMVELVKQAALEGVASAKPVSFLYGVVAAPQPLEVRVDQKTVLYADSLMLTRNVTDHVVPVSLDTQTEAGGEGPHTHAVRGEKTLNVLNALKAGERVLLARVQGGRKFVILDRLEG